MIRINTLEAGKTIALTAATPIPIDVCNIEAINLRPDLYWYNQESAELTIKGRGYFKISGCLYLNTGTEENANLTISLLVNAVKVQTLYSGLQDQRILVHYERSFEADDVLIFEIESPDTVTVETTGDEQFFSIEMITK